MRKTEVIFLLTLGSISVEGILLSVPLISQESLHITLLLNKSCFDKSKDDPFSSQEVLFFLTGR